MTDTSDKERMEEVGAIVRALQGVLPSPDTVASEVEAFLKAEEDGPAPEPVTETGGRTFFRDVPADELKSRLQNTARGDATYRRAVSDRWDLDTAEHQKASKPESPRATPQKKGRK